jgi:hypothetical protein
MKHFPRKPFFLGPTMRDSDATQILKGIENQQTQKHKNKKTRTQHLDLLGINTKLEKEQNLRIST